MAAFPTPERLAGFSVRRPWTVVGIWTAGLVLALVSASMIGDVLTTEGKNYVDTDSLLAEELIEQRLWGETPANETIVVQSPNLTVDDAGYEAFVRGITSDLRALTDDVESVSNTYESPDAVPVSEDRRTTIIDVTLKGTETDAPDHAGGLMAIVEESNGAEGFTVAAIGDGSTAEAFTVQAEKDLQMAEIVGIPVAIIILLAVFGALVAAGLPLVLGIVSIVVAIGVAAIVGRAFELSIFMVNFVTTMGLAVGIDYALLIIKRFREERANGLSRDDAIVRAGGTASRAVLFSGMAVIVALFGMVIVPNSIFRSMGIGAILVVAAAVIAALTLLPAVLRLLGDKVNAGRIRIPFRKQKPARTPAAAGGFWDSAVRKVMAHPWISVTAAGGLLILAALPYATIKLGWSGVSTLPEDTSAYQAFQILDEEFSAGMAAPAQIVIDAADVTAPDVAAGTDRLLATLEADSRFGVATVETSEAGDLALISVPVDGDPESDEARHAVQELRSDYIPQAFEGVNAQVLVGGQTAAGIDDSEVISSWTIPVFAFVLGLSFIILLIVFRSIVVPIKAIFMNLLSVGAAYGLMVLVFQHGVGNELFGFETVERIEVWVPLFMFATLFGLSMDYHVFLLTRIREHFDHTGDNTESVAFGVRATASMITGAALIMVAVFGGFATGELVMFQQMGFGLAVAVLIDATIVRVVLVPATMALLGDRNWYLPSWLGWMPKVDVEGVNVRNEQRGIPAGSPAGGQ